MAELDPLLGRTLGGKYQIEARLGDGSMGVVYRARQIALDKLVAVKILHRAFARERTFVKRFQREAMAASRLEHPSSVRIDDFGQADDGTLYIVMEFVEGRSLLSLIETERRLEPRRIANILSQVLAALAVAHRSGVVHRDLKPENILVCEGTSDDGEAIDVVKVCDFGIAAIAAGERDRFGPTLTVTGTAVGTPEYMSPEQVRGDPLDARSDLYSLGVVLYEMLVRRQPFTGETPLAIALQHIESPVPRPSEVWSRVDPALESICMRAMAKDRESRFQSATEMRNALRGVPSIRPPPEQARVDIRGSVGIVGALIAATLTLAVGAFAARKRKVDGLAASLVVAAQPVTVAVPSAAKVMHIAEPIEKKPAAATPLDGTVKIGSIKTTNAVPISSVRLALSHAAFGSCYRTSLGAGTHDEGFGVLHLSLDDGGRVISATLSGALSKQLRTCIEGASRGLRVKDVDTGDASADVFLGFQTN